MTSKLKCPFCQTELHKDPDGYYSCYTDNCSVMSAGGNGASGTESLWQALIQTQKNLEESLQATLTNAKAVLEIHEDLDVARKALKELRGDRCLPAQTPWEIIADKALETIGKHNE